MAIAMPGDKDYDEDVAELCRAQEQVMAGIPVDERRRSWTEKELREIVREEIAAAIATAR